MQRQVSEETLEKCGEELVEAAGIEPFRLIAVGNLRLPPRTRPYIYTWAPLTLWISCFSSANLASPMQVMAHPRHMTNCASSFISTYLARLRDTTFAEKAKRV